MSRGRILFAALWCLLLAGGPSVQAQRFAARVFDEVSVIHGILFSRAENIAGEMKELRADLYEPYHDTMARRPMVITVFGGAFVAGSRNYADMVAISDTLAHHGFVVASIDYRLVPPRKIPPPPPWLATKPWQGGSRGEPCLYRFICVTHRPI